MTQQQILNRRIRPWLALFMAVLVLSGLTAVPLQTEVGLLADVVGADEPESGFWPQEAKDWMVKVRDAIVETNRPYPWYVRTKRAQAD